MATAIAAVSELRAVTALATLDLDILSHQFPGAAVEIIGHGLALSVEPIAALALLIGRHSQVRDEFSSLPRFGDRGLIR
jgi:hypothetical protein